MKKNYCLIPALLFIISLNFNRISAQFMINGGFESVDINLPTIAPYNAPIYLAPPWNNLTGTCDVHHSDYQQTISVAGVPHTGKGNGRFVLPSLISGGAGESCYGKTLPLNSNQTYLVSFWIRQDFSSNYDIPVGVIMSENIPLISYSSFSSSLPATFKVTPTSTQYIKASFCFTPVNNVEHFISFVPWGNASEDNALGFYIDDISVDLLPQGSILPNSEVTITQNTFCVGNTVIIDGSLSTNESSHSWEIYKILSPTAEQFIYSSGQINGVAGTFDATAVINSPEPGACYRVYLNTYNSCSDKSFIDFCFDNPNISFLNPTEAICENTPIILTVNSNPNWQYSWSTGESGLGLNAITVTPSSGPSINYNVSVTTPTGCIASANISLIVHSSNNLPPWMNGINGSGDFTIFANQGDIINFNSNLFNDNLNEIVISNMTYNDIPTAMSVVNLPNNLNSQTLFFNWNTNNNGVLISPGNYEFTFTASDYNACFNGQNEFTFQIILICDQCPICVSYEDRTQSLNPLPPETRVGKCIEAGLSQIVTNGNSNVLFQAGEYINLGPYFTAEPGFEAIIDENSCINDCEDCCDSWTGFHFDEIPNGTILNFEDLDPTNDIFQITDVNHPFCAFGAQGFELDILGNGQTNYHHSSSFNSNCCPFVSPAPENPILNSSIWWDGFTENIFGNIVHPNDGVYTYLLTLYGCNGESEQFHGFIHILSSSGLITQPENIDSIYNDQSLEIENFITAYNKINLEISLFPNPASDDVYINGIENVDSLKVQLFDEKGRILAKDLELIGNKFVVKNLNAGVYYCKITLNGISVSKKLVKL